MTATRTSLRRRVAALSVAAAAGGAAVVLAGGPAATAAPDPCAASEIAKTVGTVAVNTGTYLDTEPETNQALTYAAAQPGPQAAGFLKAYFDANPQAGTDLQRLQQPLLTLGTRCRLPVTLPQALALIGNLQNAAPGGAAAGLPGLGGATPGAAGAAAAGQSAATTGTGPLPGPSTTGA